MNLYRCICTCGWCSFPTSNGKPDFQLRNCRVWGSRFEKRGAEDGNSSGNPWRNPWRKWKSVIEMVDGIDSRYLYSVAHNYHNLHTHKHLTLTFYSFWWFQTRTHSHQIPRHHVFLDSKAVTAERFAEAQELKMREREARHGNWTGMARLEVGAENGNGRFMVRSSHIFVYTNM